MPPRRLLRRAVRLLAGAALLAVVPPATLQRVLAASAGTMFEAAPFVLAAHLLRGRPLGLLVAAASCGCGRRLPGALSLPATALCWLSFGPSVALARLFAAGLLVARGWRGEHAGETLAGPLDELPAIGLGAAAASVAVEALRGLDSAQLSGPPAAALAIALGGFVGLVLPCTSAALAVAAALRTTLPDASAAILCTSGLAVLRSLPPLAPGQPSTRARGDSRFALALVAAACAWLALRGGAGLISPRLLPIVAAAVPLASLCGLRSPRGTSGSWLAPAGLLAALVLGSPPPAALATETTLGDVFSGEHIIFTGVAHRSGRSTILQRFAITCCRADAAPVAVRTCEPVPVVDGTWLEARGEIVSQPSGPALSVERWREIRPPADPFIYR